MPQVISEKLFNKLKEMGCKDYPIKCSKCFQSMKDYDESDWEDKGDARDVLSKDCVLLAFDWFSEERPKGAFFVMRFYFDKHGNDITFCDNCIPTSLIEVEYSSSQPVYDDTPKLNIVSIVRYELVPVLGNKESLAGKIMNENGYILKEAETVSSFQFENYFNMCKRLK
jgi:hypothetical protein